MDKGYEESHIKIYFQPFLVLIFQKYIQKSDTYSKKYIDRFHNSI